MEIILALVVVIAVIIFGALISMGNERQRRAIDELREQVVLWALQDLHLRREKLSRQIEVNDPIAWLNRVVAKVYGEVLDLTVTEIFDDPKALVCIDKNDEKVVLSLMSPGDIQRMKRERNNKLLSIGNSHPLLTFLRGKDQIEISNLNSGIFFDLELPIAWEKLSGMKIIGEDRLWFYK